MSRKLRTCCDNLEVVELSHLAEYAVEVL